MTPEERAWEESLGTAESIKEIVPLGDKFDERYKGHCFEIKVGTVLSAAARIKRLESRNAKLETVADLCIRLMSADPDGNIPDAERGNLLMSWVKGWMEKANDAIDRNHVLKTELKQRREDEEWLKERDAEVYFSLEGVSIEAYEEDAEDDNGGSFILEGEAPTLQAAVVKARS